MPVRMPLPLGCTSARKLTYSPRSSISCSSPVSMNSCPQATQAPLAEPASQEHQCKVLWMHPGKNLIPLWSLNSCPQATQAPLAEPVSNVLTLSDGCICCVS